MRELPDGWEDRRVDQVGDVQLGRQRSPAMMTGPYMRPYLRVANVLDGYIDYSDVLEMNFSPHEAQKFSLQPGDILLNEGQALDLVGRCAVFNGPPGMCFQNTLLRFRPRAVLPKFAAAVFKHWLDHGEFRKITRQTTSIAHLGSAQFTAMRFPYAPLQEQRRIAEILDSADQDIRHYEAASAKLRLTASGLARDLLGRVEAPEQRLAAFLSMRPRNGFSPNEVDSWTGTVALGLGCLTPDGFVPRQIKPVPASDSRYAGAWLSDGDLLISRSNTFHLVGLVGRYRDVGTPCVYPDLMMRLVPNSFARPEFLELVLRDVSARQQIKRMSQGTSGSMVKIGSGSVMRLTVKIPDLKEQDRLLSIYEADTAVLRAEEREIAKLRLLKQGLMEDLLTGRVRVTVLYLGAEFAVGAIRRFASLTYPLICQHPQGNVRPACIVGNATCCQMDSS